MKQIISIIITVVLLTAVHLKGSAQDQYVSSLVDQFGALLSPTQETQANSLTYTQQYLELKKKVDVLNATDKATFQESIKKYSSHPGYQDLYNLIFEETAGTSTNVAIGKEAAGGGGGEGGAISMGSAADSTLTVEIFDRRRKLLKTYRLVATDLESKMRTDGYEITFSTLDLTKKIGTITFARPDGSTTAKVTFNTTGDSELKHKLAEGPNLTVRSTATTAPTVKVVKSKK